MIKWDSFSANTIAGSHLRIQSEHRNGVDRGAMVANIRAWCRFSGHREKNDRDHGVLEKKINNRYGWRKLPSTIMSQRWDETRKRHKGGVRLGSYLLLSLRARTQSKSKNQVGFHMGFGLPWNWQESQHVMLLCSTIRRWTVYII